MELSDKELDSLRRRVANWEANSQHGPECDCAERYSKRAADIVAQLREKHPGTEDAALASFADSLAFMVAEVASLPPRQLVASAEATFTVYSLAAAALVGIFDPETHAAKPGEAPEGLESSDTAEDLAAKLAAAVKTRPETGEVYQGQNRLYL